MKKLNLSVVETLWYRLIMGISNVVKGKEICEIVDVKSMLE